MIKTEEELRALLAQPNPTPDIPRLRKLVQWAEHSPEEWQQRNWVIIPMTSWREAPEPLKSTAVVEGVTYLADDFCGTACCIAGNVVLESGYRIVVPQLEEESQCSCDVCAQDLASREEIVSEYIRLEDGYEVHIATVAQAELGLTEQESDDLFDARNSIAMIKRICGRIAKRVGEKF